jgi:hypothetical protein
VFPFRRKPKSIFKELFSGKVDLSDAPSLSVEVKMVYFVLVLVRADDHLMVQDRLGKFVKVVGQEGGITISMIPPLALASANVPWSKGNESERLERIVTNTVREVGKDAKLLYGCANAPCGILEFDWWSTYGVLLPNFEGLISKLGEGAFGTAIRVD